MKRQLKTNIVIFSLIISMILLFGCAKKQSEDEILVKVGNRSITKNEFLQRAELTIRPQNFNHKLHVLNNLVAEKLIAEEFENKSDLYENENYRLYIQGLQEQAMREQLFHQEAYDKVKVDSTEIIKTFPLAGREYDLAFYSVRDSSITRKIETMLNDTNRTREEVFDGLGDPENVPRKKITYMDPEMDLIHKTIFSEPLKRGQVIGPIEIEKNYHLIVKVVGWKEDLIIGGGQDFDKRWFNVSKKLKDLKASEVWSDYVGKVMKGKQIQFNKETFNQVVDIFIAKFTSEQGISQKETDQRDGPQNQIFDPESELIKQPFFTIDGKVWTVDDFRKLIISHPLIYRNRDFSTKKRFKQQFRYAVADLMRDHYLNKEAYKKNFQKVPWIRRKVNMWKDAILAKYHVNQFLKSLSQREDFDPNLMKGRDNYLSLFVDSLYIKYADAIQVDQEIFDDVKLTSVPMFAIRQNQPFPVPVPSFPAYTTKINIGRSEKQDQQ